MYIKCKEKEEFFYCDSAIYCNKKTPGHEMKAVAGDSRPDCNKRATKAI